MKYTVLLLAFLSGACGIAYEVFYARILSAYLGDIFYVGAILFATFFLGIALGALYGYRYVRFLKYFEIGIGLYAFGILWATATFGFDITKALISLPLGEEVSLSLAVFTILILPALLIGFGVPLFALYIKQYQEERAFSLIYALYNLGAALSVLCIEFFLIRHIGIGASISLIAAINICIGIALFFIPTPATPSREYILSDLKTKPALWISLVTVSIASGVLQMVLLTLLYHTLGPFRESVAMLIGATLTTITLAAIFVRYVHIRFHIVLAFAGLFSLLPFLFLDQGVTQYAAFFTAQSEFGGNNQIIALVRILFAFTFAVPAIFFFAMTIPSIVREYGFSNMKLALAISACGNAVGYLFFIFVLHEHFTVPALLVVVSLITLCALVVYNFKLRDARLVVASLFSILISASILFLSYPSYVTQIGYHGISNSQFLSFFKEQSVEEHTYKRFGNSASIVRFGNQMFLSLNGYVTLNFHDPIHGPELRESLVGTLPAIFSRERDNAFVLGLGSGITASTMTNTYDSVVVAEINPAMVQVAQDLGSFNDYVTEKDNLTVDIQDGLITLLENNVTYDAIVNTLTSPIYFSANKLWTKDFFELVKTRLDDDGVFVGWVDGRLGKNGVETMDNTLHEVFEYCTYMYLDSAYMGFICSDTELVYKTPDEEILHPSLQRAAISQNWSGDTGSIFDYTIVPFVAPKESTLVNTLDTPVLEFEYGAGSNAEVASYINENFRLLGETHLREEEQKRCDALRVVYPWQECVF